MAEHPRPWTCKKFENVYGWFITDAIGWTVAYVPYDESTAHLIVDLVDAAEVQLEGKMSVRWCGDGWEASDSWSHDLHKYLDGGPFPTPHEAIFAAKVWREKQKGGTQ